MKRIFLVDSAMVGMDPFVTVLRDLGGYQITRAWDAERAMKEFEAYKDSWPYELMIMDVVIKVNADWFGGNVLLQEFRKLHPNEKVLIFTNVSSVVPEELHDGPYTKVGDKVALAGRRILEFIKNWK